MKTQHELASEFGLTLCDFCQEPTERHMGFDHGKRECILAGSSIGMMLRYPKKKERSNVIQRLNDYYEAIEQVEEAALMLGAFI